MMERAAAPDVGGVADGGVDDDGVGVDEGGCERVEGEVTQRCDPSADGGTGARQEAGHSDGGADMAEGSVEENSAGNGATRSGPGRCGAGWWGGVCGR